MSPGWGNSGANAWDVNNSANADWTVGRSYFVNGDNATFDDTSSYHTVSLIATASPGSIEVNTGSSYAINGAGLLAGTGALSKDGAGTLTLGNSTANTFTGGILLNAGTLILNQTPGTGAITLGNGTTLTVPARRSAGIPCSSTAPRPLMAPRITSAR